MCTPSKGGSTSGQPYHAGMMAVWWLIQTEGWTMQKEQQPVKKSQESGRKKSDDNVRKLFLSANTSALKT